MINFIIFRLKNLDMKKIDSPRVGQFSIHDEISIRFMKKLNPGPEVIQIMEEGLRLPFTTDERNIPSYYEPNNRSCIDHVEVAVKKIKSWEEKGFIVRSQRSRSSVHPCQLQRRWIIYPGRKNCAPA